MQASRFLLTPELTGDNRAEAAKRLGMSCRSPYTRMASLDIG